MSAFCPICNRPLAHGETLESLGTGPGLRQHRCAPRILAAIDGNRARDNDVPSADRGRSYHHRLAEGFAYRDPQNDNLARYEVDTPPPRYHGDGRPGR